MERVDHGHVHGKVQTSGAFDGKEIEVAGGPEIVGLKERREGALEVIGGSKVRGPGEIVDFVVLEIALVRGAVEDQEERGKAQEQ
jgi:hypothetical protein